MPRYTLTDHDNNGDDGEPYVLGRATLPELVGYVDGPLRSDVEASWNVVVDDAVDALQREDFATAKERLQELGVYLAEGRA